MIKYIPLLAMLVCFSCKNNKQPSGGQTDNKIKTENVVNAGDSASLKANNDSLYRLVVLFYSIASGAEFELINEYVDSIGVYSQNLGKKIEYKKVSWGREGETDIVMKLRELSQEQQLDFIAMSKRVLAKGKYVNIYENYPYKQRGR